MLIMNTIVKNHFVVFLKKIIIFIIDIFLPYIYLISNLVILALDHGGLDGGYLRYHYYLLPIMLIPILKLLRMKRYIEVASSGLLMLSMLIVISNQKIYGNYIVVMTSIIVMSYTYIMSTYLSIIKRNFIAIYLITLTAVTTYLGLKNWSRPIALGEDRLWRSFPWHNPSGIMAGSLFIISILLLLKDKNKYKKILYFILSFINLTELYLSGSRGSILLTLIFAIIAISMQIVKAGRKNILKNIFLILTVIVVAVGASKIMLSFDGGYAKDGIVYNGTGEVASKKGFLNRSQAATGNFTERLKYWKTGLKIFKDHQFFGSGIGSWNSIQWRYRAPNETLSTAAHNDFIQILAEGGITLFAGFAFIIFLTLIRIIKKREIIIGSGILLLLSHSFIDFNTRYPIIWVFAFILFGFLNGVDESKVKSSRKILVRKGISNEAKVILTLILILIPILVIINGHFSRVLVIDKYNYYVLNNYRLPSVDKDTAFNSEVVVNNIGNLINKGLYNNALVEAKLGEIYNRGDIRIKMYKDLIEYKLSEKSISNYEKLLEQIYPYYSNSLELTSLYIYFVKGEWDLFNKKIENLNKNIELNTGWEYNSTKSWVLNYMYRYEVAMGEGCGSKKAEEIKEKFIFLMEKSEEIIRESSIPNFNSICMDQIKISK